MIDFRQAITGSLLCFLAACHPLTSMPPPTPSVSANSGQVERGVALGLTGVEAWHVWDKKVDYGLMAGVFGFVYPYAGGMVRFPLYESDKSYLGIRASLLALAGANVGIPMSFAIGENRWLYTGPSVSIDFWRNEFPSGFIGIVPIGYAFKSKNSRRRFIEGGLLLQGHGVLGRASNPARFTAFPYFSVGVSKIRHKNNP